MPEELKKEVKDKVSKDYLNSQEFLVFISNALKEAVSIKNIEKLGYFRSAIINGIISLDIEEGRKVLFIDALSNLSLDSLILLKSINDMCDKERDASLNFKQIRLRNRYDNASYLMANLRSLERYNLVEIIRPTVTIDDYANYAIYYGSFGKKFISFIMNYQ